MFMGRHIKKDSKMTTRVREIGQLLFLWDRRDVRASISNLLVSRISAVIKKKS